MYKEFTPYTEEEEMFKLLREGRSKGTSTYIDIIDPLWTWRDGEVNILSGYANQGKSLILKQLCLIKALEEEKKFVFYSPEEIPYSETFDDMIHTLSGKSTDKDNPNFISEDLYKYCLDLIKDKFIFLYIKPPQNTLEEIFSSTKKIMEKKDIYGIVIDPYVKLTRSNKTPERDDLAAAYLLNIMNDFSKTIGISSFLVMHQQTPKIQENGLYPKPNMYSIKSGGTFADTADNVLAMWRPFYAKDKIDPTCIFSSEKIKKQKLVGVPGEQEMSFDRKTNRYCYPNSTDSLYNWDKWLPNYKKIKTF